jgi:hypothetical protein
MSHLGSTAKRAHDFERSDSVLLADCDSWKKTSVDESLAGNVGEIQDVIV